MLKKIVIAILLITIIAAAGIYYFWSDIFKYSADTIIRNSLPSYVKVDGIVFDLKEGKMTIDGLAVKNAPGYTSKHLAEIAHITCRYKMKGDNILDGIEVTSITADKPVINIERRSDGRINVNEMEQLMATGTSSSSGGATKKFGKAPVKISDLVKLTDTIDIREGAIIFKDAYVSRPPYETIFNGVNCKLVLDLNADYTKVLLVKSNGSGVLGGDSSQRIGWVVSLDPTAAALTMSNRFDINGVEVTQFKPYYDSYSPIEILRGWCSGTLVFDFDHGNIGSMNTLVIKGLQFAMKSGGTGASSWQADLIPEMIRYLQSNPGEVTFDFKIKGPMDNPRFYPGPRVKQAIQTMTVDKVSEVIQNLTQEEGAGGGAGGGGTDAEKVMNVIKGLMNK
ncbi:MAG: hypothetical protein WBD00_03260 [Candidatus Omnitrophota bacterium]